MVARREVDTELFPDALFVGDEAQRGIAFYFVAIGARNHGGDYRKDRYTADGAWLE